MKDVETEVRRIVRETCDTGGDLITLQSHLIDDLGADSLALVEMVLEAEETFEIEIPDEDLERLATVGDAVEYLRGRVAKT